MGQIPAGLAADRFGRLPTIYFGMSLFVTAACVSTIAEEIDVLLIARFIQGDRGGLRYRRLQSRGEGHRDGAKMRLD